jgi:hypothetical protein
VTRQRVDRSPSGPITATRRPASQHRRARNAVLSPIGRSSRDARAAARRRTPGSAPSRPPARSFSPSTTAAASTRPSGAGCQCRSARPDRERVHADGVHAVIDEVRRRDRAPRRELRRDQRRAISSANVQTIQPQAALDPVERCVSAMMSPAPWPGAASTPGAAAAATSTPVRGLWKGADVSSGGWCGGRGVGATGGRWRGADGRGTGRRRRRRRAEGRAGGGRRGARARQAARRRAGGAAAGRRRRQAGRRRGGGQAARRRGGGANLPREPSWRRRRVAGWRAADIDGWLRARRRCGGRRRLRAQAGGARTFGLPLGGRGGAPTFHLVARAVVDGGFAAPCASNFPLLPSCRTSMDDWVRYPHRRFRCRRTSAVSGRLRARVAGAAIARLSRDVPDSSSLAIPVSRQNGSAGHGYAPVLHQCSVTVEQTRPAGSCEPVPGVTPQGTA